MKAYTVYTAVMKTEYYLNRKQKQYFGKEYK